MDSLLADIRTDFACPLAASYVGSSDRRTDGLGATFLFCILIIPYSPFDLKNYSLVLTKVYTPFIPGGLILHSVPECAFSQEYVLCLKMRILYFSAKIVRIYK